MRDATNKLYDMLDQGVISHKSVVEMCLAFMSEDDVAEMMDANELSERFFEEEVEQEEDYDDSMDGDAESALASAGWGTDEDYGGGYSDEF